MRSAELGDKEAEKLAVAMTAENRGVSSSNRREVNRFVRACKLQCLAGRKIGRKLFAELSEGSRHVPLASLTGRDDRETDGVESATDENGLMRAGEQFFLGEVPLLDGKLKEMEWKMRTFSWEQMCHKTIWLRMESWMQVLATLTVFELGQHLQAVHLAKVLHLLLALIMAVWIARKNMRQRRWKRWEVIFEPHCSEDGSKKAQANHQRHCSEERRLLGAFLTGMFIIQGYQENSTLQSVTAILLIINSSYPLVLLTSFGLSLGATKFDGDVLNILPTQEEYGEILPIALSLAIPIVFGMVNRISLMDVLETLCSLTLLQKLAFMQNCLTEKLPVVQVAIAINGLLLLVASMQNFKRRMHLQALKLITVAVLLFSVPCLRPAESKTEVKIVEWQEVFQNCYSGQHQVDLQTRLNCLNDYLDSRVVLEGTVTSTELAPELDWPRLPRPVSALFKHALDLLQEDCEHALVCHLSGQFQRGCSLTAQLSSSSVFAHAPIAAVKADPWHWPKCATLKPGISRVKIYGKVIDSSASLGVNVESIELM